MNRKPPRATLLAISVVLLMLAGAGITTAQTAFPDATQQSWLKFNYGSGPAKAPFVLVNPEWTYTDERGFGYEPGAEFIPGAGAVSEKSFSFSAKGPEGNYRVTVVLGNPKFASTTTVKAELRRLMLEQIHTEPGQYSTNSFVVNVRRPQIAGGGEVHLKDREKTTERAAWDDKLTLEFDGDHPSVAAISIVRADDAITVFLLGDSTMCDQPVEPWGSWGQMLPRFFKPDVAVANHAESGDSLKGSMGARRLDKILSVMKPGDYLFIQFGHNDQKERGTNLAFTSYKVDLKTAIARTREHGGIPVLVTSMERKAGLEHPTLGDYPEAMRQTAKEENVTLIDLNAMSLVFYRALGADLGKAFQDGTHHNNYGSYELAKCVVEGIRKQIPGLAEHLADDVKEFDPAHPDPLASFKLPASPAASAEKPLGN